mmetsp:Transcript_25381/g.50635  ORF Transcript_25381/g.50635 Transcript_25381/m.50635 type:complete len:120 (+) Transcript_25381:277-636(+)
MLECTGPPRSIERWRRGYRKAMSLRRFLQYLHPQRCNRMWLFLTRVIPGCLGFFVYHPASSVRMSASPASGAVDPKCRVWGWEGIRVADASVMPSITSGNTNVPTAAIAHNCVEIMLQG